LSKENQEESKDILEQEYYSKFKKGRIDFNILRGELIEQAFIEEEQDYDPLSIYEKWKWVLTRKGLNVAKEKHKSFKQ
jgi:hypothetical protein